MKKTMIILSLIFGCFLSSKGFANYYVGIIGGGAAGFDLQDSRIDTSCGYYLGGRVGMSCLSLLRIEEEISFQRSSIHSISKHGFNLHNVHGHVNFWSLMTNVLVDLDCPFIVSPYFGGGIGYAHENGKGDGKVPFRKDIHAKTKMNKDSFAWQALVGIKYFVCLGVEASLEYRYFKVNDVEANHKLGVALTKLF